MLSSALRQRWLPALVINGVLAVVAWRGGGLDRVGAATGALLGFLIYLSLGAAGFALLAAFYILGDGSTRFGMARKQSRGLAQAGAGRRTARNVLANASVAACWAVVALSGAIGEIAVLAFAAALAAATGDTLASEIGQLVGGRTRLILDLSPVAPGTEGGLSLWGSLAGLGGCFAIGWLGLVMNLYSVDGVWVVTLAGVGGVMTDSLLGATLERRGLLDNEGVNFGATLVASLAALLAL